MPILTSERPVSFPNFLGGIADLPDAAPPTEPEPSIRPDQRVSVTSARHPQPTRARLRRWLISRRRQISPGRPPPPPLPPPPPPPPSAPPPLPAGVVHLPPYASFGGRVGAKLLDWLLYGLLISPFAVMAFVSAMRANDKCYSFGPEIGEVGEVACPPDAVETGPRVLTLVIGVVGMLIVAVIYLRALGRSGQTWGRRIARVRVVRNHTGEPIGFGRALGRQLFAFVTRTLLLGYLWMLWDGERQTWHDKIADTVVVES